MILTRNKGKILRRNNWKGVRVYIGQKFLHYFTHRSHQGRTSVHNCAINICHHLHRSSWLAMLSSPSGAYTEGLMAVEIVQAV